MDFLTFKNIYWNYYLQLENDFFSFSPYCEIDEDNSKAFSIKYLQLLLAICGEIDSVGKIFCKTLDNTLDITSCGIKDYINIINTNLPTFAKEEVILLNYKYKNLQPWKSIINSHIPNWWQTYNDIKHHRQEEKNGRKNYKSANQKNVIEALSALYVLTQYWAASNFVHKSCTEEIDHTMQRLKSEKLNLIKWDFYNSFLGQEPWFEPDKYFRYIEGK